jgi:3-oxoacyl-[acyl-carrier protein] reductase
MRVHRLIDLTGRVALITGGSRGIGAATAALMAKAGADVAIIYRRDSKSALTVGDHVRKVGSRFFGQEADVSDYRSVRRAVAAVVKRFGRIDIVVNSAGIWTHGEIGKLSERSLNQTLAVNLKGVFNV